jgi:hypothetical protein
MQSEVHRRPREEAKLRSGDLHVSSILVLMVQHCTPSCTLDVLKCVGRSTDTSDEIVGSEKIRGFILEIVEKFANEVLPIAPGTRFSGT